MSSTSNKTLRKRRSILIVLLSVLLVIIGVNPGFLSQYEPFEDSDSGVLSSQIEGTDKAIDTLKTLPIKGRAPKTGYSRSEFGDGWARIGNCDLRNIMLQRGMTSAKLAEDNCVVLSGTLSDPYTGKSISFIRGSTTSDAVQIDHVVALSDAWQKGAQELSFEKRNSFANDSLNLLAVDGPANQQKGDSDAASWLPDNKSFRCRYVARQIAVKSKYSLWVTEAEKAVMNRILNGCGEQLIPIEN